MVSASASGGTLIGSIPTNAPRPNGKLMVVRSQLSRRMKRLVAIANGMIGGQRNVIVFRQRAHHFLERADAALAVKRRAVVAGAADGADTKPLGGDGVEFAVAVPRDQHLGAMARLGLDKRRHEMLAVPERENRRHLRLDDSVDAGRIETEFVGQPDQPQILGREETHSALKPAAAQHITEQLFQRAGFVS